MSSKARWRPLRCRAATPIRAIRSKLSRARAGHPSADCHDGARLLLTNDIPGISATGVLSPSPKTPGASDLVVTCGAAIVTGGLAADNRGSRFSGLWTMQGDVEFNAIFGADQLGATLTSSPDACRTDRRPGALSPRHRR